MSKSSSVITIACVSILAASFAQQSQASQPAPQPAQTPAAVVPVAPASTCPAAPVAPTITTLVAVGTTDIKGTATAPVAGCASEVQIRLAPAGTVLPLAAGINPTVSSDGTFSLKLQTGLTAGQTINVTQAFASMNGTPAPHPEISSATVAIPAAPAAAAPAPAAPTPTQQKPAIAGALREGSNAISGTIGKLPANAGGATCSAQVEVHDTSGTGQLLQMSGGAARGAVGTDNTYSLTLQEAFRSGQKIRVDEIFQNCAGPATLSSDEVDVVVPGDWGRVKGYFTSGILLSQNQNSFSQSSLFMGFNLDKTWRMPGYYHQKSGKVTAEKELVKAQKTLADANSLPAGEKTPQRISEATIKIRKAEQSVAEATAKNKFQMGRWPGINTFFDVRLTSIPVSACNLPNGASGSNSGSCAAPSPTPTPAAATVHQQAAAATPSPTPLDTFLSQRKTARLTVGAYFPFTITSWTYNKTPNALFIAPLAKVGFDTPAGDLAQVQSTSTNSQTGATTNTTASTVTAVNQTNFYNFFGYGARIGHYGLTNSRNEAPELISYLDVIFGPFSNLESLIIPETGLTTGQAAKRTRLYRLALEGILKVPSTPMIIGFSANVGQETLGLGPHTIVQRAGDDLRFLFGVRFDAAKLMSVVAKAAP
jgi:hypothetical protein